MNTTYKRLEARVEGRVQGVCFRYYTRQRATELELQGWVKNEPDGAVRVAAEGAEDRLQQLLEFLDHGPPSAKVTNLKVTWSEACGDLGPFAVVR